MKPEMGKNINPKGVQLTHKPDNLKNKDFPKSSYLYFQFHGAFPFSLKLRGQTF